MEETAIITQGFGCSDVAACKAMYYDREDRRRRPGITGAGNAPADRSPGFHSPGGCGLVGHTAGSQGFPCRCGVEVTGPGSTADLYNHHHEQGDVPLPPR